MSSVIVVFPRLAASKPTLTENTGGHEILLHRSLRHDLQMRFLELYSMTLRCPFCTKDRPQNDAVRLEHGSVYFLRTHDPVLQCGGMIIPFRHVSTPFELTQAEWNDTFELLCKVKLLLDQDEPDGYNIGWNVNPIAGQTVSHVHLHVVGRFADEPLARQGIRHHLKKPENLRGTDARNGGR